MRALKAQERAVSRHTSTQLFLGVSLAVRIGPFARSMVVLGVLTLDDSVR